MDARMKTYEVTLKRRETKSLIQNMRQRRELVRAESIESAKSAALAISDNRLYFVVDNVRTK